MTDLRARVRRVADAVETSWASAAGGSDVGPCVGVLAALALLGRRDADGPDPAEQILGSSDEEIAQLLMEVWCLFTIARPELAFRCGPFAGWLNSEPPDSQLVGAAAAVARTAVEAGVLKLTLDLDVAREIDLLGHVYTQMQSPSARQARGEFYTPPEAAELMAGMIVAGGGSSVCDPTAGTGGLFRAAAKVLRAEGRNPHEVGWFGCDISRIAVAGLAVNAHIWGLGPHIVVGCADSLMEPDWQVRALREQQAAIEAQESRAKAASLLGALEVLTGGGS